MRFQDNRQRDYMNNRRGAPSMAHVQRIRRLRRSPASAAQAARLSDAYRKLLREYSTTIAQAVEPDASWVDLVREAVTFLGGQPDRESDSLADYDHHRYGPFLGV